jgi:NADPH:quinone reductase-like Zn-dependent oxidoreductase
MSMPLPQSFKAMVVSETADKKFPREVKEVALGDLPAGELVIEVKYSSLNYKDALSATGNKESLGSILTPRDSMPQGLSSIPVAETSPSVARLSSWDMISG